MKISDYQLPRHVTQNARVHKAAARGARGMIVSQSRIASEIGVAVLNAGGNAADAAVAAAFTLASVEPWNSGLGGIGFGLVRQSSGQTDVLDFGPVAPLRLLPSHFPTTGRMSRDIFAWPEVEDARNVNGPLSFCVPSAVAGYGLLHERFGRLAWKDVLFPAVEAARRGMPKDWFSTIKIAQSAQFLRACAESARIYLPGDTVPIPPEQGAPGFLKQGRLADTLERIRQAGYRDFYRGDLARDLVRDFAAVGGLITGQDLDACQAQVHTASCVPWRGSGQVYLPGSLTAAPTFARVVEHMAEADIGPEPNAEWYAVLAQSLRASYAERLAEPAGTCTSHLAVTDENGLTVSLTTTLVGTMGSRTVLPQTGVLMNNGAMWFDPRPGRANSVEGGKRPLTNMLPLIYVDNDQGRSIALGASGGRRILASVYQLLSYAVDFKMDLEAAAHQPRIDVSSPDRVAADHRLNETVLQELSKRFQDRLELVEHGPVPLNFACPSAILREPQCISGVSDTMTPWSCALAQ